MTLYVDSSALVKRYVDEHDSALAVSLMGSDPVLATSRLAEVEVRRTLARVLEGDDLLDARRVLQLDLDALALMALDPVVCGEAARISEATLCRSLDAIHIASAVRAGANTVLLTFDVRQAQAARTVGLSVVGV